MRVNNRKNQNIIWRRLDIPGHEYARISETDWDYSIYGAAIFVDDSKNCKLDYFIRCSGAWETVSAQISGTVGDRVIEIEISAKDGKWKLNGDEILEVEGCSDIDLSFSPVTNTLPFRRCDLQIGETKAVRAAWLKFPEFKLEPLEQEYTRTGENIYHYESANGAFVTDIEVDEFGLVVKYPKLWEMEEPKPKN